MCYFLRVASPLTLSEVRSMLPSGIVAQTLPTTELARLRARLPSAQTAAHLLVGACSCDLVRPRLPDSREDERHLRGRYASMGLSRERIIRELERHRRRTGAGEPPGGWAAALAGFVAEHARNAGPTLYHLGFEAGGASSDDIREALTRTVAEVLRHPDGWLAEGQAALVIR